MAYSQFMHTLDAKNRFFIPASLRDELGEKVLIIRSPDGDRCLFAYNRENWEEICDALIHPENPSPETRREQRRLFSSVSETEPDKSGRITLSQELKAFCGIEKDVVIIGAGKRVEIWSKEEWSAETGAFSTGSDFTKSINF